MKLTLNVKFVEYGKHFDNDSDRRDIYDCTLSKGSRNYIFKFGQSIYHSGKNKNFEEPEMYGILACLTKYDPGTFEDFCGEFGYDEDSESAEKTYNSVLDEWQNMKALFTDEELEVLRYIN